MKYKQQNKELLFSLPILMIPDLVDILNRILNEGLMLEGEKDIHNDIIYLQRYVYNRSWMYKQQDLLASNLVHTKYYIYSKGELLSSPILNYALKVIVESIDENPFIDINVNLYEQ